MSESALGETGSARKIPVSSRDTWYCKYLSFSIRKESVVALASQAQFVDEVRNVRPDISLVLGA